jgi:hypothetical protein
MKVVCMDCLEGLGDKPDPDGWDKDYEAVSHGLCPICMTLRQMQAILHNLRDKLGKAK